MRSTVKHLQENSLETLLNIFNYIWTTGKFPEDWQYATFCVHICQLRKQHDDPVIHL